MCNSAAFDEGKALIVESGCELDGENLGALVHLTCPVQLDTAAVTESVTGATVRGALTVRAALIHPNSREPCHRELLWCALPQVTSTVQMMLWTERSYHEVGGATCFCFNTTWTSMAAGTG